MNVIFCSFHTHQRDLSTSYYVMETAGGQRFNKFTIDFIKKYVNITLSKNTPMNILCLTANIDTGVKPSFCIRCISGYKIRNVLFAVQIKLRLYLIF